MKRTVFLIIATICTMSGFNLLSNEFNCYTQSAKLDMGTTEGKPVTNGTVFIDGKYIDPPYIVTRRGNGIFINGHLVEQPCPWPIPEKVKPVIIAEDPKMPYTITVNSSRYDMDVIEYIGRKRDYNLNRSQGVELAEAMAVAYAELPCVQEASAERDYKYLKVKWTDGSVESIRIIPFTRKSTEWTPETVLKQTNKVRTNYEDRLIKGDYFFLGTKHSRMTGTIDGARMVLSALVPILMSSKDAEEVEQRMKDAGIFFDARAAKAFFTHRIDIAKVKNHLEKLSTEKVTLEKNRK